MSFLDELKRRRVVRVALIYSAVAYAIIQAADVLVPALHLPASIISVIAMVAVAGFPIALIMGWAYDFTPDGIRRATDVTVEHTPTPWVSARTVAAVVAMLVLAGGSGWAAGQLSAREGASARESDGRASIAVLPFANLSGQVENEYFSNGLAEELLNLLARVDGLDVAARTSAFLFKDRNMDVRTIGDSLGVATVLEGSVRRDGERVRVTAQLIKVANGYHLWSDQYDAELSDVFAVQERIARSIADALQVELRGGDALTQRAAANAEAHDAYLRGLDGFHRRGSARLREAIGHFERAIAADSNYAQAWAGLALVYSVLPAYDSFPEHEAAIRTRAAAQRASALDDRLAEPYAAICQSASQLEWKWEDARRACDAALARNPSFATAHQWKAELLYVLGDLAGAEASALRAIELNPLSAIVYIAAGVISSIKRDPARAEQYYRVGVSIDSTLPYTTTGLVRALLEQRKYDEVKQRLIAHGYDAAAMERFVAAYTDRRALPAARAVIEAWPQQGNLWMQAYFLASLGDTQGALRYLERSVEQHEFNAPNLLRAPYLSDLQDHPRYRAVLRRMGLEPYFPSVSR
ncbi:MAG: hypothetical protein WEE89_03525 [Gemmatimonadota bacterium]